MPIDQNPGKDAKTGAAERRWHFEPVETEIDKFVDDVRTDRTIVLVLAKPRPQSLDTEFPDRLLDHLEIVVYGKADCHGADPRDVIDFSSPDEATGPPLGDRAHTFAIV
jgi:hypothetical protein